MQIVGQIWDLLWAAFGYYYTTSISGGRRFLTCIEAEDYLRKFKTKGEQVWIYDSKGNWKCMMMTATVKAMED